MFHTDGVTEARAGGEDYGLARLRAADRGARGRVAAQIGERILADVSAFMGDTPRGDDLTLLVVKVR